MFLWEVSLLQKKVDVTISPASHVTLLVSLFGHKIQLLWFTEFVVYRSLHGQNVSCTAHTVVLHFAELL